MFRIPSMSNGSSAASSVICQRLCLRRVGAAACRWARGRGACFSSSSSIHRRLRCASSSSPPRPQRPSTGSACLTTPSVTMVIPRFHNFQCVWLETPPDGGGGNRRPRPSLQRLKNFYDRAESGSKEAKQRPVGALQPGTNHSRRSGDGKW